MFDDIEFVLSIILMVMTLPGMLELAWLTVGAMMAPKLVFKSMQSNHAQEKTVIVIPAHNEELTIEKTVKSVLKCRGGADIVVIVDNCTDMTAQKASGVGARVIERHDPIKKGKSYALDFAFSNLLGEGYSRFMVIDADTVVHPNFVEEANFLLDRGAKAVQVRYGIIDSCASYYSRLKAIGFNAFNYLRPRGRVRLGFSAGLLGNGMAFTRDTLLKIPYQVDSIVEDLAYHLRLVRAGISVHFTDKTMVQAEAPHTAIGAVNQRARWEGGRLRAAFENIPELFRKVLSGNWLVLEPLLDLLLMPLAYQCTALIILLVLPSAIGKIYAGIALGVIGWHVIVTILIAKGGLKDFVALFLAPFYLLWKLKIFYKILSASKKDQQWVRTDREKTENKLS